MSLRLLLLCCAHATAATPTPTDGTLPCACVRHAWQAVKNGTDVIPAPGMTCFEAAGTACVANGTAASCELLCMYQTPNCWSAEQLASLMGEAAQACGAEWMTEALVLELLEDKQPPVWYWTKEQSAITTFFWWSEVGMPEGIHDQMLAQRISGAVWMSMTARELYEVLGLVWGGAIEHKRGFVNFIEGKYGGPPKGPDGGNVSVYVSLERLVTVDPPSSFTVQMSLFFSWYDPRISKNCAKTVGDEADWSDVCTLFWRPSWTFPTTLDEPTVVEDYGTDFHVGADSPAAATDAVPGLNRSFGLSSLRIRAEFITVMEYLRYPYDTQNFDFVIQASNEYMASEVRFHSLAVLSVDSQAKHQVWDVRAFSSSDGLVRYPPGVDVQATQEAEAAAGDMFESPAFAYFKARGGADGQVSAAEALSSSAFEINVRRYCGYYLGNYVVLESVLVFLGWITFFMAPDGMDSRLGIALTLVLAINVFQIVLVENLPETGYLTDLSLFTICNTVLLALIAIETVFVCEAHKRVKVHEEMLRMCKEHVNNQESIAAAARIQRKVRVNQARRRLRTLARLSPSEAAKLTRRMENEKTWEKTLASLRRRERHGREGEMACGSPVVRVSSMRGPSRVERQLQRLSRVVVLVYDLHREQKEEARSCSAVGLLCRAMCLPCASLHAAAKLLRVKINRWVDTHSRFFAYETDRLCALVVFPSLFLSYFFAIFMRPGGAMGNCSQRD